MSDQEEIVYTEELFSTTSIETVRDVYRQRIKKLYETIYPKEFQKDKNVADKKQEEKKPEEKKAEEKNLEDKKPEEKIENVKVDNVKEIEKEAIEKEAIEKAAIEKAAMEKEAIGIALVEENVLENSLEEEDEDLIRILRESMLDNVAKKEEEPLEKKEEKVLDKKDDEKPLEKKDDEKPLEKQEDKKQEEAKDVANKAADQKVEVANNDGASAQKKLEKALKLLDEEYFGNEQQLYEIICKKYKIDPMLIEKEYVIGPHYRPPLVSELFLEQELIKCNECSLDLLPSEFNEKEILNGHFAACKKCEPDRNNIQTCKWSELYKSGDIILENNRYVAKTNNSGHKYVLVDGKPVKNGVHVWRWYARKVSSWCMFGISAPKAFDSSSYSHQTVFGIAGGNSSYANGAGRYDVITNPFYTKEENYIDMMLDLNNLELKYKLVGDVQHECKLTGITANQLDGWTPHMNMYYAPGNVQIKKIPAAWYGKPPQRVKFQY